MVRGAALLIALGCGPHAHRFAEARAGDDVTLYRDAALVRQRIELAVPAGPTIATVRIAAGVTADQVLVIDRGGIAIGGVHLPTAAKLVTRAASDDESPPSTELELDVSAPKAGHYPIVIAYVTDRLRWDAAYTMTTTASRDRAVLGGAVAIRNSTGIALHDVAVHVIDAELGAWRGRNTEHLATTLVGGTQGSTPAATPRDLGRIELPDGETRVDLVAASSPRPMRAVLVYDPIRTELDHLSPEPLRDLVIGTQPAATRITESFEVDRDESASIGLPAGPVRLLERGAGGALAVIGESRLFDAATRVANVDTIAIGSADGVIGHRERREITIDDEARRIVEEFVITLDNARAKPVGVLVREHLYRGQNWTLAYHSAASAEKEGAQQIALRTVVPAKAQTKLLYVVVYTW